MFCLLCLQIFTDFYDNLWRRVIWEQVRVRVRGLHVKVRVNSIVVSAQYGYTERWNVTLLVNSIHRGQIARHFALTPLYIYIYTIQNTVYTNIQNINAKYCVIKWYKYKYKLYSVIVMCHFNTIFRWHVLSCVTQWWMRKKNWMCHSCKYSDWKMCMIFWSS